MGFPVTYSATEKYFRKAKELKAAHMEIMAKLGKMYLDKLNLKEVQPVIIKEDAPCVCSRSVSGKNSNHPISLMT